MNCSLKIFLEEKEHPIYLTPAQSILHAIQKVLDNPEVQEYADECFSLIRNIVGNKGIIAEIWFMDDCLFMR